MPEEKNNEWMRLPNKKKNGRPLCAEESDSKYFDPNSWK
jgi:hypothetical protein